MNKGNTIGIPFHAALAAAIIEAGITKCSSCFTVLSRLAAASKLTDGHRTVFDAFTDAAGKLGFTGETQIVRQTAISLMSKDPALISKRFGIPADILGAYVPTKQFSYDQSIVAALKSLADTNGDKKAYEALAQLVGETKMDEGCRASVFNALYESAKTLNMLGHQVVLTAAVAVMSDNPTMVSQRFGADIMRVKEIISALKSKPASSDTTKHASSSQQKPSPSPDKHRHTQVVPPKSAPTQQAQPSARMTGGTRS